LQFEADSSDEPVAGAKGARGNLKERSPRPGPRTECREREKLCSRLARTELSLLLG